MSVKTNQRETQCKRKITHRTAPGDRGEARLPCTLSCCGRRESSTLGEDILAPRFVTAFTRPLAGTHKDCQGSVCCWSPPLQCCVEGMDATLSPTARAAASCRHSQTSVVQVRQPGRGSVREREGEGGELR